MIALKVIYVANIVVAGWISLTSLFAPQVAQRTVFEGAVVYSEAIRLVGALWLAITVLSAAGLVWPRSMVLVLVFQVIYKGSWLLAVALPAQLKGQPYPKGMTAFFVVWVLVLPFIIPWKSLLNG